MSGTVGEDMLSVGGGGGGGSKLSIQICIVFGFFKLCYCRYKFHSLRVVKVFTAQYGGEEAKRETQSSFALVKIRSKSAKVYLREREENVLKNVCRTEVSAICRGQ